MKNLFIILITVHCSLFTVHSFCQSCLPEGIVFSSQAAIDNFQSNYPDCEIIEGYVKITGSAITNLHGLDVITSIHGNLVIKKAYELNNLAGLDNLTDIGGNLEILECTNMNSLTGMTQLNRVDGNIHLYTNYFINNMSGLENLDFIEQDLIIEKFNGLKNLGGLEKVTQIFGDLVLKNNKTLQNLTGLDNAVKIHGKLIVGEKDDPNSGNPALTSLTGLEKITTINGDCSICWNALLSDLTGLNSLDKIGGSFILALNDIMSDLTGLDNLNHVGFDMELSNYSLTNTLNLSNLSKIGGSLTIKCPSLSSLHGFENLNTVGGSLIVLNNYQLTSLSGLDNLSGENLDYLQIINNPNLSLCAIQSICDYLALPDALVEIADNAAGCNSRLKVELGCDTLAIQDIMNGELLSLFPNPCSDFLYIRYGLDNASIGFTSVNDSRIIQFFTIEGKKIMETELVEEAIGTFKCAVNKLPSGLYIVKIWDRNMFVIQKLMISH